jgi:hypothetical protein
MLCVYMSISEAIRRHGRKFDMGSERYQYKSSFRASRIDLDRLEIYRSPVRLMLNVDNVAKSAMAHYWRRVRLWLEGNGNRRIIRIATSALTDLRSYRRLGRANH